MKAKSTRTNRLSILISCGVLGAAGALALPHLDTSALSYQTGATIGFTFNPSLTVSISDDLTISSLTPGSYADSNIINVGVVTNAINGYVLQATAGTNSTTNRLVNIDSSSYYFESLGVNETVGTMSSANDNTWGYSYSTDNGTTWISAPSVTGYSGLPQDTNTIAAERGKGGKTLIDTNDSASNQSIKFKIGAKAATTQAAGEYTNTINFYAVTYPEPEPVDDISDLTYMQDFADLTSSEKADVLASMTTGAQYQLDDERDGKTYYISKLADGNVWMTQNLDFDIVNGGAAINSTNTDVPSNWADGGNLTNTRVSNDTIWEDYYNQPESYNPGNLCWNGVIRTDYNGTLTNSTTACSQSSSHLHIGNYYNWTAAVAMANSSSYTTDDTDVNQSICPAGWTLPKSGSNTGSGSFAYLKNQANLTAGTSGNIHTSPYYFVYGGAWEGGSVGGAVGGLGRYWSPSVHDSTYAYYLSLFNNGSLSPNVSLYRYLGHSVRCAAR